MSTRLYESSKKTKSNIELWGRSPQNFFEHLQENYDTKNDKKLEKIKPYNELIKDFIEIDKDKSRELEVKEYENFANKIFNEDRAKKLFKEILNFAAGKNNTINIYEWLIINYFFEKNSHTDFVSYKLSLLNTKRNYKKFVDYVENNTDIKNYIDDKYEKEKQQSKKIQQIQQTKQIQLPQKIQQQTQQQIQQTQQTQQIQKKIELVKKFNKNLNEFKADYQSIKDIIEIKRSFFSKSNNDKTINVQFKNELQFNKKFNKIIQKNNNNCKNIINTIKPELNNDNPNIINIKIFILLCYYINQLNCILNKFNKELKENYKSDFRFKTNNNNINSLKIELQKIINNSNDEIDIEKICTNVNIILDRILKIFRGIHTDLSNFNNQSEYLLLDLNNN